MMESNDVQCPFCSFHLTVKFPCCGYMCMKCGNAFEEDIVNSTIEVKKYDNNDKYGVTAVTRKETVEEA